MTSLWPECQLVFTWIYTCSILVQAAVSSKKKSRLHYNLSCVLTALSMHCSFFLFFLWLPRNQRCISEEHKGKDYVNLNEFSHRQLIYISKCIWRTCFHYLSPQQGRKKKENTHRLARMEGGEWTCAVTQCTQPCLLASSPIPSFMHIHNNIHIQYIHIHTPTSLWLS